MIDFRIGHGFDVHAFGPGDHVVLGGVSIAHDRGLIAHSDGDVLLHAVADALLGAAGHGDIGRHFPDDDPAFAGASSRVLLRHVVALLNDGGWSVGNVDATVVAQAPRIARYVDAMRENIASDVHLAPERINVKGTTTERLGYLGRGEGIAVHAVAAIRR